MATKKEIESFRAEFAAELRKVKNGDKQLFSNEEVTELAYKCPDKEIEYYIRTEQKPKNLARDAAF